MTSGIPDSRLKNVRAMPDPHNGAPGKTSFDKDRVENRVKEAICAGQVKLADAQHAMLTNWTTALDTLGIH
jgi:hypothetical protein